MLTDLCAYLKNWFDTDEYHKKLPRMEGEFVVSDGKIAELEYLLVENQYFYIYGSLFNDGVHKYDNKLVLIDEKFYGLVQSMRIDPDFLALVKEMEDWEAKYGAVDSVAMSPYNSESFGGYSYSKSSGNGADNSASVTASDPKTMFKSRLNRWRKL